MAKHGGFDASHEVGTEEGTRRQSADQSTESCSFEVHQNRGVDVNQRWQNYLKVNAGVIVTYRCCELHVPRDDNQKR